MKWAEIKATIASKDIERTPHTSFLIWHLNNAIAEIGALRKMNEALLITAQDQSKIILQQEKDKAELVTVLRDIVPPTEVSGWWCPTCKEEVSGVWVTHNEYHETCGTYLGDSQPKDWAADARALLAKHGGEPK